jgi:three-Cys-motif partner protein
MSPDAPCWEIEPHTRAKHLILRRYLQAWLPIMTRWNGRVVYIDGFAGPGIYKGGEEGSPMIALKEAIQHTAGLKAEIIFLFIELKPDRLKMLEKQIAALTVPANMKVLCKLGKFDEHLTEVLNYIDEQKRSMAPTFAFLDPFGFSHTPFSLVKRLMQYARCEVLITFMYEEINRFLSHPDQPGNYDALFGCPDWREAVNIQDPLQRKIFIHNLYMKQLSTNAGIDYVRSFEMMNRGNRTDYFLFFGTKNIGGLKKMKAAMWTADEAGGFQFSDTTDVTQALLFQPTPNYDDLRTRLTRNFGGKKISVDEVEKFVVTETPYRETHYKSHVLRPMELSSPPGLRVTSRAGKNRKGTFPAGTIIEIL